MTGREREVELLRLVLIYGKRQSEVARRWGISRGRVGQIMDKAYRHVADGKISLPSDFDISTCPPIVKQMVWRTIYSMGMFGMEGSRLFDQVSQLTIYGQLNWIREQGKLGWYK